MAFPLIVSLLFQELEYERPSLEFSLHYMYIVVVAVVHAKVKLNSPCSHEVHSECMRFTMNAISKANEY